MANLVAVAWNRVFKGYDLFCQTFPRVVFVPFLFLAILLSSRNVTALAAKKYTQATLCIRINFIVIWGNIY